MHMYKSTRGRMARSFALLWLTAGLLGLTGQAVARDKTPPPLLSVTALSPTALQVSIFNRGDHLNKDDPRFEWQYDVWINQFVNGVSSSDYDNSQLSLRFGLHHTIYVNSTDFATGLRDEERTYTISIYGLIPATTYCYMAKFAQYETAVDYDNLTSDYSDKVCATTPALPAKLPNRPNFPVDVKVEVDTWRDQPKPYIGWSTPDQSGDRGIDSYTVERRRGGEGYPWVLERTMKGPAGKQTIDTQLNYAFFGAPIDPRYDYEFRVCSVNAGGVNCLTAPLVKFNSVEGDTLSAARKRDTMRLDPAAIAGGSGSNAQTTHATNSSGAMQAVPQQKSGLGGMHTGTAATTTASHTGLGGMKLVPQQHTGLGGMQTGLGAAAANRVAAPVPAPIASTSSMTMSWLGNNDRAMIVVGGKQSSVGQVRQEIVAVKQGRPITNTDILKTLSNTSDNALVTIGLRRITAAEFKRELRNEGIAITTPVPASTPLMHNNTKTMLINPAAASKTVAPQINQQLLRRQ
jgi:hypothetical protein